jgi:OOP family OmpA-OmpF porin
LTLIPSVGYYDFDDGRGIESKEFGSIGFGYQLNNTWTLELVGAGLDSDIENSDIDLRMRQLRLDALYTVNPGDNLQGYFVFGGGHNKFKPDAPVMINGRAPSADDVEESIVNYGVGLKYAFTEHLALRGDVRGITSLDEEQTDTAVSVALSWMYGETSRVRDDSDGDGVSDKYDQCPNTPAGVQVDSNGCALDSDKDGVADHIDQCPNTPAGVEVNANGCAKDDDGDGVANHKDKCPDTAAGAKVDADGCYLVIAEDVKVELNVEFDTNSAESRPSHYSEVKKVADFMRQHPLTQVLVEGHTDDTGSAAYNQRLSERRAATIANQLINDFGVTADRVSSVGVGEARPIADNSTEEGRQRNRRVVAVVSAKVERRDQ